MQDTRSFPLSYVRSVLVVACAALSGLACQSAGEAPAGEDLAWDDGAPVGERAGVEAAGPEEERDYDFDEALAELARFAEAGNAQAQFELGLLYADGVDVPQDLELSARWYRQAARQDHRLAQVNLGLLFDQGLGMEAEARRWWTAAAVAGFLEAQVLLAASLRSGPSVREREAGLEWLEVAAEAGHPESQAELGCAYAQGAGIARDFERAAHWFALAAEAGLAQAQANLARLYLSGAGVDRNAKEAARWMGLAAEQGDAGAQDELGRMYARGQGVPKDERAAFDWFHRAAFQGLDVGEYNLGLCYLQGRGTPRDADQAVLLFERAANQGLAMAQAQLGAHYEHGRGVAADLETARHWYTLAAEQGEARARDGLRRLASSQAASPRSGERR